MRSDQNDSFVDAPTGSIRGGFLLPGGRTKDHRKPRLTLDETGGADDDSCAVYWHGVRIHTTEVGIFTLEYGEAGVNPALPRNCERGRNLRQTTRLTAGKEQGVG
jgi:hypothetical protein